MNRRHIAGTGTAMPFALLLVASCAALPLAHMGRSNAGGAATARLDTPEKREGIRAVGRVHGRVACGEAQVREASEIKPKAWGRIQSKCGTFMLTARTIAPEDESLAYSLCIGAALEECQTFIGIAEPCRDLATCRAQLGVP